MSARRPVCSRCRRPTRVCYCRHINQIETTTRIVLLQHPRERDMAIGTAHMANLCLPNSELHVGIDWSESVPLRLALSDPARPPVLLYPGKDARDVLAAPPRGPVTLVVVDGTWWQTRKIVRRNPVLAALPRYAFTPPTPSEYRIRKEPNEVCVSTIEALMHTLGALEGNPHRFRALLDPFRAMIDAQIACREAEPCRRRRQRPPRPAPPRVPPWLGDRAGDLVCVVGDANAWRYGSRERTTTCPDELVCWLAFRLGTGESFAGLVAPRNPLAPATSANTELPRETLASGGTLARLMERWRGFLRPNDVLCGWGSYSLSLFAAAGGSMPDERVDLRPLARVATRQHVSTLDDTLTALELPPSPSLGLGRAGRRLGQLVAVTRRMTELAREDEPQELRLAASMTKR